MNLLDQRRNEWIQRVGWDGEELQHAPIEFRQDREIVLAAVQQNGWALQYASEELKRDREIVLAAFQEDSDALQYASDELKQDREFVLAAVQQNGQALQDAANELKQDKEIVFAAVQQNGRALKYTAVELKQDREIVLAAVQQDWHALEFAAYELKRDREIVLAAVQQNGYALQYASDELKRDREFVLAAVQQNGYVVQYAADLLKSRTIFSAAFLAPEFISFQTMELLYIKEVSRVVEEMQSNAGIEREFDAIKSLIRSFLPRVPDKCRLSKKTCVYNADWLLDSESHHVIEIPFKDQWYHSGAMKANAEIGDSIWVTYSQHGGESVNYLNEGNGSNTGIARVRLLSDPQQTRIRVKIRDAIPFERFYEYFEEVKEYRGMLASTFESYLENPDEDIVKVWRSHDGNSFGVDIRGVSMSRDYCRIERLYRQRNETWVHAYKHPFNKWPRNSKLPIVGLSFMSEKEMQSIQESFVDSGILIEDHYEAV